MDWGSVPAAPQKVQLAETMVSLVPRLGVRRRTLAEAARLALGDSRLWSQHFPGGPSEALWFVSEVSDASMAASFRDRPAAGLPEVIVTRFAQNAKLKPFVLRVMFYDFLHPVQALARMQRTAREMDKCRMRDAAAGVARLTTLNLLYTATVMVWLADRSQSDRLAKRFSSLLGWL